MNKMQLVELCDKEEVLLKKLTTAKFKERGEYKVMSYNHKMIGMKLLDRKHVNLLSTAYGSMSVNTGRKH